MVLKDIDLPSPLPRLALGLPRSQAQSKPGAQKAVHSTSRLQKQKEDFKWKKGSLLGAHLRRRGDEGLWKRKEDRQDREVEGWG